jgi:predicted permease
VLEAIGSFSRDLLRAWRRLGRSLSFTLVVTATLAIGIGANAAVVSIIDAGFFRKLAVTDPDHVVEVYSGGGRPGADRRSSFPDYLDLRGRVEGLVGLAAEAVSWVPLNDSPNGTGVVGAFVSGNYFSLLGVGAARGRTILPDEESPRGANPVVVISDAMWRSRFGSDERIVGRPLTIGRTPFVIVGVLAPGFNGINPGYGRVDVWLPFTMHAEASAQEYLYDLRDQRLAIMIGRLARGANLSQVQLSVDRAARDLATSYPQTDSSLALGVARHDHLVMPAQAPGALPSVLLAWAMIALVHLVAASNVTSLMLARAAARRHELGVRLCLGASRGRVIAESLSEPFLLALFGIIGGVLIARWLTTLATRMQFLSGLDPGLDWRVLGIVAVIGLATMLEFGFLPALDASRRDPWSILRAASGTGVAPQRDRTTMAVITGQVALSLVLLANAAVVLGVYRHQVTSDVGYDTEHVLLVDPRPGTKRREGILSLNDLSETVTRLSSLPAVKSVAAASSAPLYHNTRLDELAPADRAQGPPVRSRTSVQFIGPGYFRTIGARIVKGREFSALERAPSSGQAGFDVVIVNETLARRFWPGLDAVGKRISSHSAGSATVVGVVHDLYDISLTEIVPRAYFPLLEARASSAVLLIQAEGDLSTLVPLVLAAVTATSNPNSQPVVQTMAELRGDATRTSEIASIGLTVCSGVAILLTTIGLYGLVSTWVSQRQREIGIRLALGGSAKHVHTLLLNGIAGLFAIGTAVGFVGAFAVVRLERAWWGPSIVLKALPLVASLLLFLVVAAVAVYVPSRRAARIEPAAVLRMD